MRSLVFLFTMLLASFSMAQPNFKPADSFPPEPSVRKQIAEKTATLKELVSQLQSSKTVKKFQIPDVEVYLKAAEWIVKYEEWTTKDADKQTLRVLDAGITRAMQLKNGETPWLKVTGKPVVRGYYSAVDGSVQPFSVTVPTGFFEGKAKHRVDVVLHGRDQTLTEVKFINSREASKGGSKTEVVILEPYGRGNNAYRWAGENDVFEALSAFNALFNEKLDSNQVILRGFSMGGAGSWHIGLHYAPGFAVVSPGAGFTTTRGYIKNLPEKLPDYQEKCLRIYDAVLYAENAFNVPIVAYSGGKDPQKAAADNIETALKGFGKPLRFTHIVAPDLEHKLPPEWQANLEVEYRKYLPRKPQSHVRFVTYTTKYGDFDHGVITSLDKHYEKAVVDSNKDDAGKWTVSTINIHGLLLHESAKSLTIDGQVLTIPEKANSIDLTKSNGSWKLAVPAQKTLRKGYNGRPLQGPIDDAFTREFSVTGPSVPGYSKPLDAYHKADLARFSNEWERFLRGKLPRDQQAGNEVLFGDPQSNPAIAKLLPKLPIKWTAETLVVNGKSYDAKTHFPVLIYPHPERPGAYVVINSGHTFHEADFRGTNALLYPRLGDWAVIKPTPTTKDPVAAEVVAAGLFNESWQFE
jgi:hypothetical protein